MSLMAISRHAAPARILGALATIASILAVQASAAAADSTPTPRPSSSAIGGDTKGKPSQLTFGMEPVQSGAATRGSFYMSAAPGATLTDMVSIYNYANVPLAFRLYSSDALNGTTDGGFALLDFGQKSSDVGTWVTASLVGSKFLRVGARTRVDVPFTVKIPPNATPGDHIGGIVVSAPSGTGKPNASGVFIEPRIGVPLRVRVSGQLRPELSLTSLTATYDSQVKPWSAGSAQIALTVRNSGNVSLGGTPGIRLVGPLGFGDRSLALPNLPVIIPGQSVTVRTTAENVWPVVKYDVTATVVPLMKTGDPVAASVSRSTALWAIPWPQLITLLLLILLGTAYWRWRRSRPQPASGRHGGRSVPDDALVGSMS